MQNPRQSHNVCVEDITDQEKTFAHVNVNHVCFNVLNNLPIHLQTLATADIYIHV